MKMSSAGRHQQAAALPQRMRIRPLVMMVMLTSLVCGMMMMMMQFGVVAAAATTTTTKNSHEVVEPKTGIVFPDRYKRNKLHKLGVRSKGPLKVYAVGLYGNGMFVLKMKMSVSAEKISGALADALKPRCLQQRKADEAKHSSRSSDQGHESFCQERVNSFKNLILKGLPGKRGGATTGTTLAFDTSGGKISLFINDKSIGSISSTQLARAFAAIYTDKNAVCVLHPIGASSSTMTSDFSLDLDDPITIATLVVGVATLLYALYYLVQRGKNAEPQGIVVSELNVYPIKSCAEHRVQTAVATELGFQGDRIAMVTDAQGVCCTARNPLHAKLFKLTPTYNGTTQELLIGVANRSILASIQVDTTKSQPFAKVKHNEAPGYLSLQDYGNAASAWLTKETGIDGARLTGIGPSYKRSVLFNPAQGDPVPTISNNKNYNTPVSLADEAPFLLTNEKSLVDLNRRLKARNQAAVDMRRFRPNIVIKGSAVQAWEEDSWKKIRIGERLEFFVWQRCGRCTMTTIDRDSLDRCGEPLATLSTFRERSHGMRNFGMHLIPDPATFSKDNPQDNVISEHDIVQLIEYDADRRREWEAFVRSNP
jgi:uncharacterized protein